MNTRLVTRGMLAGAVGGLVAFAFIRICAEPIVGHAINLAGARMHPASAVDDHGVELFSPSVQASGELAFVVVSFGIAMGALLAAAFAITYVHIESVRPGGACTAARQRCIRRIVVGAVDKVSARAGPRSDHLRAHRLVSLDGRRVGGVGDRRRHLGAPHRSTTGNRKRHLNKWGFVPGRDRRGDVAVTAG